MNKRKAKKIAKSAERNSAVIRYYRSEKDDFFHAEGELPTVDGSYRYIRHGIWHGICRFVLYRLIATPIAFFYSKLVLRDRYYGKEKLKPYKKLGYFVYSNHTQAIGDAFSPNIMLFPKRVYVVVGKDNLALPVIKSKTAYLGAIPLPDDIKAARNFKAAIEARIREGSAIVIYPEAHVWEYYTEIRPFGEETIEPAMRLGAPVFTATRIYKSRGEGKKPRSEIYIDGPFFEDTSLGKRDARSKLHSEIRFAMEERALFSDCKYITYIRLKDKAEE